MTEFTRQRKLSQQYCRVALDENDLARLATLVQEHGQISGDQPNIQVRSGDGDDVFQTSDPSFFIDQHMPRDVGEVTIAYERYDAPVTCRIEASAGLQGRARLTVDGTDPDRVSGLFRDLNAELSARQLPGANLVKALDTLWVTSLLCWIVAAAVFSVFDVPLDIATSRVEGFGGSTAYEVIAAIGWVCVFIGATAGGFKLQGSLKRAFPAVQFSGRLTDQSAPQRTLLIWIVMAVVGSATSKCNLSNVLKPF